MNDYWESLSGRVWISKACSIVLLPAVSVVVVTPGGAAIPVLFLSFAVAGLAVVFAVAGLAVVLIRNPLELMEDEFRTFAALVNVARRIIKLLFRF